MDKLFQEFSITQIFTFIILLAAAIKGLITFFDWAKEKMREKVHKDEKPETIEQKLDVIEATHCKHIEDLKAKDVELQENLFNLAEKMDLLIDSDKDHIKCWITEQYHKFTEQGWIDSYTLDCLEQAYKHYQQEDGNSFITSLMESLRKIPIKK